MRASAAVAGSLALIVAILYYCVAGVAFDLSFYNAEYRKNKTSETIYMELSELLNVTEHMLKYLEGKNEFLQIEAEVDGVRREFFSERELMHMDDVKGLFETGHALGLVCILIFIIILAVMLLEKGRGLINLKLLAKALLWTLVSLIAALTLLCVLAYLDFERAFTAFHHIFFNNELWMLDPETELLINIVPLDFFIDISKRIAFRFAASLTAAILSSVLIIKLLPSSAETSHGS